MPDTYEKEYKELSALIQADGNKELECSRFLKYVPELLIASTVIEFVHVDRERRGTSGDADFIISCKVRDETGMEAVKAYIWELKAPQCHIFEKDTENRVRPTKELIQAENQLLHYYHEHRGSDQFRDEFGVTHPDNVLFGGIIIGSHDRRVRGDYEAGKRNKLFEKALKIRKKYIYDPRNIRILHWDYILAVLKPSGAPPARRINIGQVQAQPLDPGKIVVSSS